MYPPLLRSVLVFGLVSIAFILCAACLVCLFCLLRALNTFSLFQLFLDLPAFLWLLGVQQFCFSAYTMLCFVLLVSLIPDRYKRDCFGYNMEKTLWFVCVSYLWGESVCL